MVINFDIVICTFLFPFHKPTYLKWVFQISGRNGTILKIKIMKLSPSAVASIVGNLFPRILFGCNIGVYATVHDLNYKHYITVCQK